MDKDSWHQELGGLSDHRESRRRFLEQAAGIAAAAPLSKAVERVAFPQAAGRSRAATAPEMIQIPEYMVYAGLPDGKLVGLLGAPRNGDAVARYSSDEGATWGETTPLFPLDASVGSWGLHNCFLDRDRELQLLYTNDANTSHRSKSIYEIDYDIWHVRSRDGQQVATLHQTRDTAGPSYLHVRSTSLDVDKAGLRVQSVAADVSASYP